MPRRLSATDSFRLWLPASLSIDAFSTRERGREDVFSEGRFIVQLLTQVKSGGPVATGEKHGIGIVVGLTKRIYEFRQLYLYVNTHTSFSSYKVKRKYGASAERNAMSAFQSELIVPILFLYCLHVPEKARLVFFYSSQRPFHF